jgi:sarcosine oxidase subunit alpha
MQASRRIARGALIHPDQPLGFSFDGRQLMGLAGDTLASALLANGQYLVGRSFKYHRPRGIVTAGPEEPCALVDVIGRQGREPNRPATTLALYEGLVAHSQNRWPSLRVDLGAINDRLSRFLPAGFYYKTFMAPGWAWEKIYEPLIRRAAGLGRLEPVVLDHAPAETVHDHCDVLVVGAGAAGMAAALALRASGLRVLLAEAGALGGGMLLDEGWTDWRHAAGAALAGDAVRCLARTTVIGAYGHGVFAALEELSPEESARFGGLRERLRIIRARRLLLATGAIERLIAFPGNDVPGVMLAGAALAYLRRYGVAVGQRPVFFVNNDPAYEAVFALLHAGIAVAAVVDPRPVSLAAERARALGVDVHGSASVVGVEGRHQVRAVTCLRADGRRRTLDADCLLMSGGHTPATALASQLGAPLRWHEAGAAFTAALAPEIGACAGAVRGLVGLAAARRDGAEAAAALIAQLRADGPTSTSMPASIAAAATNPGAPTPAAVTGAATGVPLPADAAPPELPDYPADPSITPLAPLWEVPGAAKAFVDLQNDVTTRDVRLAVREGYSHVEHMKRYTTHGMATDQGRIGGLVGVAVLAAARGVPLAELGQLKPRPYVQPLPFAALGGAEVGQHFKPKRRLPLHDWHESAGATFVCAGIWLRPLVYSKDTGWATVLREARSVRRAAGITDVSTLGKIDVQGRDAARFLDFIYANTFSTLAVGRARYGIMLREDGLMLDDGTTSRLAAEHFLVTTTTVNAVAVLEHMEFHLQTSCAGWEVMLTDVGDQWAQFALAGPRARDVLAAVVTGLDVSALAFPFMAAAPATIAGVPGRLFRISFSGELAYELAVPATAATQVWQAVLAAGQAVGLQPYGLDALNTLRIEKGHVTGAELNGNTSAEDLGFGRMLKKSGDFIGRRLAQRTGLAAAERLQLVGVRPIDPKQRLRNGAQLVDAAAPRDSLGYITSSTPSVEVDSWVGLALLANGRQRLGQRLTAASPVHDERIAVDIVSPHHVDPENHRVRA